MSTYVYEELHAVFRREAVTSREEVAPRFSLIDSHTCSLVGVLNDVLLSSHLNAQAV